MQRCLSRVGFEDIRVAVAEYAVTSDLQPWSGPRRNFRCLRYLSMPPAKFASVFVGIISTFDLAGSGTIEDNMH